MEPDAKRIKTEYGARTTQAAPAPDAGSAAMMEYAVERPRAAGRVSESAGAAAEGTGSPEQVAEGTMDQERAGAPERALEWSWTPEEAGEEGGETRQQRLYQPDERLMRWFRFVIDVTAHVYLYVGLDPVADFECTAHVAVGANRVTMTPMDLGLVSFMRDIVYQQMDDPRPRDGSPFYRDTRDMSMAVVANPVPGEPGILQLTERSGIGSAGEHTVRLTKAQLVALFALKEQYDQAFVVLEREIRPSVRTRMQQLAAKFRDRYPAHMPVPRYDDMVRWCRHIFAQHRFGADGELLEKAGTPLRELITTVIEWVNTLYIV